MYEKLNGSKCVVLGATGNIGRGAASSFLRHGASKVAIVGRNARKLESLRDTYLNKDSRVEITEADIATVEGAQSAAKKIKSTLGQIDHLVSSAGPWWNTGPFFSLDPKVWQDARRANIDSHFYAYRYLGGLVKKGGSYVIINGAAADGLPGTGLTGICALTVRGLSAVLMKEGTAAGLRIHELLLHLRVADGPPMPGMKSKVFGEVFSAIAVGKASSKPGVTIIINSEKDVAALTDS
jgi:2-hydroxycyclohexanecarboxyl-CoA dehydrogenase